MVTVIRKLIEALNAYGVRYCHWKSNLSLAEALSGRTDVDLLIHRNDVSSFRIILSQLCFRPTIIKDSESFPSVEHYFALDDESGILAHVHAYFRVITGESLVKNYRLPIEEMLLQNTREINSVRVPIKSAELVVFTLRMMLKHTSLVELVLLARDQKQVRREIAWLLETDPIDEALKLINHWLPSIDTALFSKCVASLNSPAPLFRRIILGHRLRSQLSIYARHSAFQAWLSGVKKFASMLFGRLIRSKKGMVLQSGGAVIAFVGPEATGKSTLLVEMSRWLGEHFAVKQIHAGKPKSTVFSAIPNLFLPALRSLLPTYRSGHVETQYVVMERPEKSQTVYPLIFALRSVLLAYDRHLLLTHAFREAADGTIVLCDRYPSINSGASDSPQLSHLPLAPDRYPIRHLLARIEKRLYREIPSPDLVILLSVPVDVAILRNENRGKKEPEDYVRLRHAQSSSLEFGETPIYKINTDQPLEKTALEVKKAIWKAL
jgi:thymidylate kinase